MLHLRVWVLGAVLTATAAAAVAAVLSSNAASSACDQLNSGLRTLESNYQSLKGENAALSEKNAALSEQLDRLGEELNLLAAQVSARSTTLSAMQTEVAHQDPVGPADSLQLGLWPAELTSTDAQSGLQLLGPDGRVMELNESQYGIMELIQDQLTTRSAIKAEYIESKIAAMAYEVVDEAAMERLLRANERRFYFQYIEPGKYYCVAPEAEHLAEMNRLDLEISKLRDSIGAATVIQATWR